jgi:FMN reductase
MPSSVQVVGLGGSMREGSTSLTALRTALDGAEGAAAQASLIGVRELDLPMYAPQRAVPGPAREFADTVYASDAMIWSTPTYHGSVSGSFKNALDWLILLAERDPPYLASKPVGLISTAGGPQGLQAVNSLHFIARALCGWSVPMVLPVAQSWQAFDPDGRLADEMVAGQLRELGAEVVRATRQFQVDGTCDYAEPTRFGADGASQGPAAAGQRA